MVKVHFCAIVALTLPGAFNFTIRLDWPKQAILEGSWHPPALERLP